jgi:hypothetical protein
MHVNQFHGKGSSLRVDSCLSDILLDLITLTVLGEGYRHNLHE